MSQSLNLKIGTAPDSWGVWFSSDPLQPPWQQYLDEAAAAGYEWTELGNYGYLPSELPTLGCELQKRNLKVSAAVVMAHLEDPGQQANLEHQLYGSGPLLAGLGARYLVLIDDVYSDLFTGAITGPRRLDQDAWKRLIDKTHEVADIARAEFDLELVFHPHAETHVEYEDQIEALLEATDPARVKLCLDTGHHAYRGGDPISFMRRHHKRIAYLHLKSVDRDIQRKVEKEKIPFAKAVAIDMFCEPAQGAVDFAAFRDVLREVGYNGLATVEQDMYPAPFDKPLPIAKRTRSYLRDIGIG